MSHEGKMRRGEKWLCYRDADGNLPDDIKNHPSKMEDVNYYLENTKEIEEVKKTKKKGEKE